MDRMEPKPLVARPASTFDVAMSDRLGEIIGDHGYAEISRRSGLTPATVRRYLSGYQPSASFIAWVVREFDGNPWYVLLGEGPPKSAQQRAHDLSKTGTAVLFAELARRQERLEMQVELVAPHEDEIGEDSRTTSPS